MSQEALTVYCTVPNARTGHDIAETLVRERLCACVNRISGVTSHYIYDGEYFEDAEELMLIKTTSEAFEALQKRIEELHPYEIPEIIGVPVRKGNAAYLEWLAGSVKS